MNIFITSPITGLLFVPTPATRAPRSVAAHSELVAVTVTNQNLSAQTLSFCSFLSHCACVFAAAAETLVAGLRERERKRNIQR